MIILIIADNEKYTPTEKSNSLDKVITPNHKEISPKNILKQKSTAVFKKKNIKKLTITSIKKLLIIEYIYIGKLYDNFIFLLKKHLTSNSGIAFTDFC